MNTKLSREAYQDLIEDDIKALIRTMPNCLARDHIIDVLRDSVNFYYGPLNKKYNNKL